MKMKSLPKEYILREMADQIIRENLTPDAALKRRWFIRGNEIIEGKIEFIDDFMPEDLVNEALKLAEELKKKKRP
jgi:hypothetical protein